MASTTEAVAATAAAPAAADQTDAVVVTDTAAPAASGAGAGAGAADGSSNSIMTMFAEEDVAGFPFPNKVVEINSTCKVVDAFRVLITHGISSVPIFDEKKKTYLGFVSVGDLAHYIVDAGRIKAGMSVAGLEGLLELVRCDMRKDVSSIVNASSNAPFLPVTMDQKLVKVITMLSSSNAGASVHRVPVLGDDGRIKKLISQSAVIQWLNSHVAKGMPVFDTPISDLDIGTFGVVTITTAQTAMEAFQLLVEKRMSSVGIVDSGEDDESDDDDPMKGRLLGQICAHDVLTLASAGTFTFAALRSLDFVAKSKDIITDIGRHGGKSRPSVITVRESFSLRKVVERLAAAKVHRVYVVDSKHHPLRIISLKDILHYLVAHATVA